MTTYYVDGDVGSDANAGTSPGAGNAFLTVAKGLSVLANGDLCYVKKRAASAVYSISTGLTFPTLTYTSRTRVIGYGTTPGDGIQPTIQASAGITLITTTNGVNLEYLCFDGNNVASTKGILLPANGFAGAFGCLVKNCKSYGMDIGPDTRATNCEVTGCSSLAAVFLHGSQSTFTDGYVHDNSAGGIDGTTGAGSIIRRSRIVNNTGVGVLGIYSNFIVGNTIHGNSSHGIELQFNYFAIQPGIRNNVITSNGGYGLKMDSAVAAGTPDGVEIDYNAYYSNTSGARLNLNAGAHDVTLTGDPYTNSAGNDFTLNNTAGAGAACRAAGYPQYLDIGVFQHQDAGGGGTTLIVVDDD